MFLITKPDQLAAHVRKEYDRLQPEVVRHAEGFVQAQWDREGRMTVFIYSRVFGPEGKGWHEFDSVSEAGYTFQRWVAEYEVKTAARCEFCGTVESLNHYDYMTRTGELMSYKCDDCVSCYKVERDLRCDACFEKGEDDE
jgi:hypothetical protein